MGRAEERVPRLLVAAEHLDRRSPVARSTASMSSSRLGAWRIAWVPTTRMCSAPHSRATRSWRGHGVGADLELLGADPALGAQARERALLEDLPQLAVLGLARRAGGSCSSRCRCRHRAWGPPPYSTARWTPRPSSSEIFTRPTGRSRRSAGIDFEVARGEVFGLLGPNGAGQDVDGRDPRGLPRAHERHRQRAGPRPGPALGRRCAGGWASSCRRARSTGTSPSARSCATGPALYPAPRDVDEVLELAGLVEQAGTRTAPAVRRPAAAPGLRAGARRRSRADLPRRADDRLRPRRAPAGVADDPLARRARQDRPAHHALPRRGPGAVRPGRDRQGRAGHRHRRAGRARQRRRALPRDLARPRRRAARRARPTTRPRCCTS